MIKTFVGLPGAGKSLYFSWLIAVEIERIKRGKSKYDYVAINFDWNDNQIRMKLKWDFEFLLRFRPAKS